MESKRQQKVSKLLVKELGTIIQRQLEGISNGVMITVTKVNVTPDLSIARVYLSIFGATDGNLFLKDVVRPQTKEIRFLLGQNIRHQVRIIPTLDFFLDDSLDYIERIDELLKQ